MGIVVIEKNIPIPKHRKGNGTWKPVFDKMEPGDSVVVPTQCVPAFRVNAKLNNSAVVSRRIGTNKGFSRVWLVERAPKEK